MCVCTHMLAQASSQWVRQTSRVVQWHPQCLCQHRDAQPTTSTQQTCATHHSPCLLHSSRQSSRYTDIIFCEQEEASEWIRNIRRTLKTQITKYVNWINEAGLLERDKSDFHFGGPWIESQVRSSAILADVVQL
jgi:hypothetical protein